MGILHELQERMRGLENRCVHDGYWYRVSDALVVMICGLLCRQQKIDDIHDWAKSAKSFCLSSSELNGFSAGRSSTICWHWWTRKNSGWCLPNGCSTCYAVD